MTTTNDRVSDDTHNHRGNCFDDAWNASGDGIRERCDEHPQLERGACDDCPECLACFDEAIAAFEAEETFDDESDDDWKDTV